MAQRAGGFDGRRKVQNTRRRGGPSLPRTSLLRRLFILSAKGRLPNTGLKFETRVLTGSGRLTVDLASIRNYLRSGLEPDTLAH